MNNQTRWIAKWTDQRGRTRVHTFYGPTSRAIACLDFKLECIDSGERIPEHFELEEGTQVLPAIPAARLRERTHGSH